MREFVLVHMRGETAHQWLEEMFIDVLNGETPFGALTSSEQDLLVSLSDALASANIPPG